MDLKTKTVELNGKEVILQIWDTAGQERFHINITSCFRDTAGIIMVYDMTDEKSFEYLNSSNCVHNVQENTSEDVQKVLLANKCDLDDKQMVCKEKGESFAQENGMKFFETSAKTNINVDTAILTLLEDIFEKMPRKKATKPNPSVQAAEPESVAVTTLAKPVPTNSDTDLLRREIQALASETKGKLDEVLKNQRCLLTRMDKIEAKQMDMERSVMFLSDTIDDLLKKNKVLTSE
ncbi:ras-related protein Rab-10-like [Anneissia japonica]|uniref:ras-related protein Rab-10-like n=1 Tax=Anneissia japonica TaxID=1529436 RepID=UPI001425B02E|nr:ras-related protein Rab-10-like [Anneissia japonica]